MSYLAHILSLIYVVDKVGCLSLFECMLNSLHHIIHTSCAASCVPKSITLFDLLFVCCKSFSIVSVGTRLMGSRSVACIASETLSDEEEDVILSLTEMVGLSCSLDIKLLANTWRRLFLAAYPLRAKPGCCCCPE